jgi:hypothetical protein
VPSVTIASVMDLQVWYSGQSLCFFALGACGLISMYLLRGKAALPPSVADVAGPKAEEIWLTPPISPSGAA